MIKIKYSGRLGNRLLQYSLASALSCKFKLKIQDCDVDAIKNEKICINGEFQNNVEILDPIKNKIEFNFEDTYKNNIEICSQYQNINLIDGGQHLEFIDNYFDFYKKLYIFPASSMDVTDAVFCHIRLGDIEHAKHMVLPYQYYDEALSKLNFKKLYIASDTSNHRMIKTLCDKYNGEIFEASPAETIGFGSKFKKMVLSGGTFSFWIACASEAETIIVPSQQRKSSYGIIRWHGDVFDSKHIKWEKI